jgi:hypothetical protein
MVIASGYSDGASYKARVRVTSKRAEQAKQGRIPATCDYHSDDFGQEK